MLIYLLKCKAWRENVVIGRKKIEVQTVEQMHPRREIPRKSFQEIFHNIQSSMHRSCINTASGAPLFPARRKIDPPVNAAFMLICVAAPRKSQARGTTLAWHSAFPFHYNQRAPSARWMPSESLLPWILGLFETTFLLSLSPWHSKPDDHQTTPWNVISVPGESSSGPVQIDS